MITGGTKLITAFADSLPPGLFTAATIVMFVMLLTISLIDINSLRIPDKLSLPLIAMGLALAAITSRTAALDHAIGAAVGFSLFAGLGEVFFRFRGVDGLGLGDAKLFAAAGA